VTEPQAALLRAASKVAIDTSSVELIRAGENHIYRLPGRIIGRVARPGEAQSVERETVVARWLNHNGINAVCPIDVEQPIVIDERAVTFWDELPPHRNGTVRQVATVLKRLHALPIPEQLMSLRLTPFVRLTERITEAHNITHDERRWLLIHLESLRQRWTSLPEGAPVCVIHGDAWAGNVVDADGQGTTLLDLERCSVGPPEWDLVSTAVRYTTFGTMGAAEYREYCTAYGRDVTAWQGYELLRDIRELRVTCYAIQRAQDDPNVTQEAQLRIDCIRDKYGPRPWCWTPA
jgi:aminoglycoside phosphotransferase (APT) family kinase protein